MQDKEKLNKIFKEADKVEHKFWNTQPVLSENTIEKDKEGPIDNFTNLEKIKKEPLTLPPNFYWDTIDIQNETEMEEFYNLLKEHYVEDSDHTLRFLYSKEFLKWALTPPGYKKEWHICIRAKPKNIMLASITGIPVNLQTRDKKISAVEINFLCIHSRLRSKRLAPVLIKEITRRVNLNNIWQAIYTAGKFLTKPVCKNQYYHRQLNPRKLINIGFSSKNPKLSLSSIEKLNSLPLELTLPNFQPLQSGHFDQAYKLLSDYNKKFQLAFVFSREEFLHWFSPRKNVVESFVAVNENGAVTDFVSFYSLSSSILDNKRYVELRSAYSFYNVATSVKWEELMLNALIIAKKNGYDVYNALNLMENEKFFKKLKFLEGDGILHYYLYNWKMEKINPNENSIVMF